MIFGESPFLSIQSLCEDLDVWYSTVQRWIQHLENVYYHFEIKPHVKSNPRSLKKEGKLYLYDWTQVDLNRVPSVQAAS